MTHQPPARPYTFAHFDEDLRALIGRWVPQLDALRGFAEGWVPAWNAHDVDELQTLVTDDITWEDPAMHGATVHGRAEFRAFIEPFFEAFPDVRVEAVGAPYLPLEGTALAIRSRMTGTFTGELVLWAKGLDNPPPTISPTGQRFDIHGVDFYGFRDGLVSEWTIVYDLLDFSRQIGLGA
jgi:steroid delta-isomerase-like uncharacterized protein